MHNESQLFLFIYPSVATIVDLNKGLLKPLIMDSCHQIISSHISLICFPINISTTR